MVCVPYALLCRFVCCCAAIGCFLVRRPAQRRSQWAPRGDAPCATVSGDRFWHFTAPRNETTAERTHTRGDNTDTEGDTKLNSDCMVCVVCVAHGS